MKAVTTFILLVFLSIGAKTKHPEHGGICCFGILTVHAKSPVLLTITTPQTLLDSSNEVTDSDIERLRPQKKKNEASFLIGLTRNIYGRGRKYGQRMKSGARTRGRQPEPTKQPTAKPTRKRKGKPKKAMRTTRPTSKPAESIQADFAGIPMATPNPTSAPSKVTSSSPTASPSATPSKVSTNILPVS